MTSNYDTDVAKDLIKKIRCLEYLCDAILVAGLDGEKYSCFCTFGSMFC